MKTCTKCSVEQPIDQFSFQNQAIGKRCARCKSCMADTIKEHYEKNKKRRQRVTAKVVRLKSITPCMDCQKTYPYYVMDFDHRDGKKKIDGISRLIRSESLSVVMSEIAKCDIVCANCHRIRTMTRMSIDLIV